MSKEHMYKWCLQLPEDAVEFAVRLHLFSSFQHPRHSLIPQLSLEPVLPLIAVVVLSPIQVNSLKLMPKRNIHYCPVYQIMTMITCKSALSCSILYLTWLTSSLNMSLSWQTSSYSELLIPLVTSPLLPSRRLAMTLSFA